MGCFLCVVILVLCCVLQHVLGAGATETLALCAHDCAQCASETRPPPFTI